MFSLHQLLSFRLWNASYFGAVKCTRYLLEAYSWQIFGAHVVTMLSMSYIEFSHRKASVDEAAPWQDARVS